MVIAVVFVLPWQLYVLMLPKLSFTMVSELSVATVLSNMERLPFIFKVILPKLFTANKYHIAWALYVVLTAWGFRSFCEAGLRIPSGGFVDTVVLLYLRVRDNAV